MTYPHRIRLRGPWEYEPIVAGRLRCRRRFGYPGRIDAYERVWLTFAGLRGAAEVRLNHHLLGHISLPSPPPCGEGMEGEFEVTSLLQPRNQLVVDIETMAEQGGLWDEVALEVRCTAFLRALRSFTLSQGDRVDLHVVGQVVGAAERPLELYLLLGRSVVGYQVVTATAEGRPFAFTVPDLPAVNQPVQVDLVNGAVVWYTGVPTPAEGTRTLCDEDK